MKIFWEQDVGLFTRDSFQWDGDSSYKYGMLFVGQSYCFLLLCSSGGVMGSDHGDLSPPFFDQNKIKIQQKGNCSNEISIEIEIQI